MTFRQAYGLATSIWGFIVIYGTYKRWPYMVGPFKVQSRWRMRFDRFYRMLALGENGAVVRMYIIGAGLAVGGMVALLSQ